MKIISIHTPKAGGTTMLELWKRAYGDDRVVMDYEDPPANPAAHYIIDPLRWMESRPRSLPENVSVVHGHFRPEKYDLVKDAFRVTMLRYPVDNVISIYCYWKKIPPQPNAIHQYFLKYDLSVIELAQLPAIRNLYCETYFGGWDMGRFDFIGRHETRETDLQRMTELLSIRLDTTLHLNMTEPNGVDPDREAIMSSAKVMARLNRILAKDIGFYESLFYD